MERTELRTELLKGMCRCAKEISIYWASGVLSAVRFINNYVPEAFKPGTADKFIFLKIINEHLDELEQEEKDRGLDSYIMTSINLMRLHYYPYYGKFRKLGLSELKKYHNYIMETLEN